MFWSQHLGCWGQNTSRIQNKDVYATCDTHSGIANVTCSITRNSQVPRHTQQFTDLGVEEHTWREAMPFNDEVWCYLSMMKCGAIFQCYLSMLCRTGGVPWVQGEAFRFTVAILVHPAAVSGVSVFQMTACIVYSIVYSIAYSIVYTPDATHDEHSMSTRFDEHSILTHN